LHPALIYLSCNQLDSIREFMGTDLENKMNIFRRLLLSAIRKEGQRQLLYGKRHQALSLFEMLCRWANTPENRFNLALAKMNLLAFTEALIILEPIHKQLPNQQFAGITYAQCLMLARRFDEAEQVYAELLSYNPDSSLLKMMHSLSQDPVGRDKFTTALEMQYKSSILLEKGKPQEALELIQQALGLTPDDAALHNNLGALKLKLNYPIEEVMADFAKAMQLSPDNDQYKRNYRKVWQKSKKQKG
jgi:tetratricopeptide (TPR) repeat protein